MIKNQSVSLRRIVRGAWTLSLSACLLLAISGCGRPAAAAASSSVSGEPNAVSRSAPAEAEASGSPLQSLTPAGKDTSAQEPSRETIDAFFRSHGAGQVNEAGELISFSGEGSCSGTLDYNEDRTVLENIGFQLYGSPSDDEAEAFFREALVMLFPDTEEQIWSDLLAPLLAGADSEEHFHSFRSGKSVIHFITRAKDSAAPAREMMVDMAFPG